MPTGKHSGHRRGMDSHMAKYPELHDPAWLRDRVAEGLSDSQIAELIDFDCTREAVYKARQRHGIAAR